MAKVAFIADVHLGVSNRLDDVLWALRVARDHCLNSDVEVVFILGDLFHDRYSLSIEVLCAAWDFFHEAKKMGQQWIVFPGNHDMFLKLSWEINSLKPLSDLVTIIDTVKIVKVNNVRFWILPFIYSESAYLRVLRAIEDQHQEGDVLLTHIGVNDSMKNICFLLPDWAKVSFEHSVFQQVYTGHFHLMQQVHDNLWFVGSIIPFKFDEGDSEHGFFLYDLDSRTHEFVNIWEAGRELKRKSPPPQFHTFHDDLLAEKTRDDINGNNIRIATTRDYSHTEKCELREKFRQMGAKKVTYLDLSEGREAADIPDENAEPVKAEDLFALWLEQDERGMKGLYRNILLRLDEEVRQEGDEIYAQTFIE